MLGVETAMHLADAVQPARQFAARPQNSAVLGIAERRPLLKQRIQVVPAVKGTGQQHRAVLAGHFAFAIERRLQGRDTQRAVTADIAKLAGETRLAQWAMKAAGQVVALTLEVIPLPLQLQAKHAAPAAATGVRFVHCVELFGPQGVERGQTVALQQNPVFSRHKITHSRPSKNFTTWRIRCLSDALRC